MDNFKEISSEVQRVWEEDNKVCLIIFGILILERKPLINLNFNELLLKVEEEEGQGEESHQETLDSTRCCEMEYNKVIS